MTDIPISGLVAATTPLTGTEEVPVVQAGVTERTTTQDIANLGSGGGAWTAYTPTLTQSGAVTKTVVRAKYVQIGKTVHVQVFLTATGAGTANNPVTVTLPVASVLSNIVVGAGRLYDASAGLIYRGVVVCASTTTVHIEPGSNAVPAGLGATSTPFTAALANGDVVDFCATYEVA